MASSGGGRAMASTSSLASAIAAGALVAPDLASPDRSTAPGRGSARAGEREPVPVEPHDEDLGLHGTADVEAARVPHPWIVQGNAPPTR